MSLWYYIEGCMATHLLHGLISSGAGLCCCKACVQTRAASATSELLAFPSSCAVQTGIEHFCAESYGLHRSTQADVGQALAAGGTSPIKTATMFGF